MTSSQPRKERSPATRAKADEPKTSQFDCWKRGSNGGPRLSPDRGEDTKRNLKQVKDRRLARSRSRSAPKQEPFYARRAQSYHPLLWRRRGYLVPSGRK